MYERRPSPNPAAASNLRWEPEKTTTGPGFPYNQVHPKNPPLSNRWRVAQILIGCVVVYLVCSTVCDGLMSLGSGHDHNGRVKFFETTTTASLVQLAEPAPTDGSDGSLPLPIPPRAWLQWTDLVASTPKPNRNSEAWVAQQAQLYKHLWRMRQFRKYVVGELDISLLEGMDEKIRSVEKQAFDYLEVPETEAKESSMDIVSRFTDEKHKRFNSTRGIVTLTGNTHCRFLLHFIATLRYVVNSTIPVEVFYSGEDDLSPLARKTLELFPNVVTKDLLTVGNSSVWNQEVAHFQNATWSLKPFALLASEFEEPILCDADVIFLQDPMKLYDDPGYLETGALFYHDRHWRGLGLRKWLKTQFEWQNMQPSPWLESRQWWTQKIDSHEQDSGVVVLNKGREDILFSTMFIAWMNGEKQREFMDTIMLGDKETFWLAFELTRQPYSFSRKYAGTCGKLVRTWTPHHLAVDNMLHFDRDLQPLWINGGLLKSKHQANSPWLEVDVYAYDDGEWVIGTPLWTYSGATWVEAPELGETIRKMTALAQGCDERYNPLMY